MSRRIESQPHPDDADPSSMPDRALMCAVKACSMSAHPSDRTFAERCADELRRRAGQRQQLNDWVTA
jgi:hypothetical protein